MAAVHVLVEDLGVFLGNLIELSLRKYEQDAVFRRHMAGLVFSYRGKIVVFARKRIAGTAPRHNGAFARIIGKRRENLALVDVIVVRVVNAARDRCDALALEQLLLVGAILVTRDLGHAE